jgi:hypothetical protein
MHQKASLLGKIWIYLCDLKLVLDLPCILPTLEMVHTLIKYVQGEMFLFVSSLMPWNQMRPSYTNFMLIFFVRMIILLFNEFTIVCEHRTELLPISWFSHESDVNYTCYHIWHWASLTIITYSIIVEVLMMLMFMWIWVTNLPWLNQWRLHV